ncbi:FecCD family ABC transporter permease [Acetivibrio mesophilus]|uniref:Iron ABC transporter permease n=1 Tax=Acetivibrio mesophilus TaxID=2487273 RepID=A0A4Q0I2X9_9FIRM|nr:iron chelate uptake ABC transporter family permease subunit [Acetivibrio mesophilus]ODM26541.1 iron ABC transporter [Clostridium sp. Bc-iso-3]RXE58531.1 iron ABC transporter permease [Acetivibrio mesophilus]HHV30627.1 iron chelate uptake ABC transporter family permease subunit [Clostridium sp.]
MSFSDKKYRYRFALIFGGLLLVLLILTSVTVGAANISLLDTLRILIGRIPFLGGFVSGGEVSRTHELIVLNIRLPRVIAAAAIGIGLSAVGATYQGMFANPMADPYVLGVSAGAALGASIAIVMGADKIVGGFGLTTAAAFIFALLTVFIVFSIAKTGAKVSNTHLLLAGVAVSFFASSVMSVLMVLNRDKVANITYWMMGSIAFTSWKQVIILVPLVIAGTIAVCVFARELNIIAAGEDGARSLGVEVEKVKKVLLVICSVIVAACVAVSGVIGFVGLIIPHTVRLISGSDNRIVLPFSAIGGGIFLVLCDTISRIPTAEIPVGVLTSMFGAPYFISILIRSKKKVV